MNRAAFALLLSWVCVGAPSACLRVPSDLSEEPGARGAPSTAAEVLEHHVEAIGGAEKLRAIKARTVEARMVFRAEEGCEAGDESCIGEDTTGSFLLATTDDGRMYRRTVLGDLLEEKGYDGKTAWVMQRAVLRVESDEELAVTKEDAVLHWYFGVDDRGIETSLTRTRKEDSDGKVATLDGVRWDMPGSDLAAKTMWFDRQTGLLREETVEEGQGEDLQRQTIIYDDYREVDGVLVAYQIRVLNEAGDRRQVVEFQTQRVSHGKIDKAKFAMPELPKMDRQPDERLAAFEQAKLDAKEAPRNLAAQLNWARAAFMVAHFDEAITASQATLAVDPREPEALFILARSQVLIGDHDAATRSLAKVSRSLRPEVLAVQRAWIHYAKRDYGKLAKELESAGNPAMASRYKSFAGKPLQATAPACVTKLPLLATAPLAVVEVELDGQKVGAIIDTGASDVIVPAKLAKDNDLPIRTMKMPEGVPNVGHSQAKSLALGDVKLENIPLDVFDDGAMTEMAGELADKAKIVIGTSVLAEFLVTLDLAGKSLELVAPGKKCDAERSARRRGASVPFILHETHFLYVLAKLDGAEGLYLLNTGMRGADMTATQLAYNHAGIGAPPLRSDRAVMVTVPQVSIGEGLVAKNVESAYGYFEQVETSDGFRLDGMIGLGVLGKTPVTLDYEKRRLWFGGGK